MDAILLNDIISSGKDRKVYGKKGDRVSIISSDNRVAIVEGKQKYTVELREIRAL